MNGYKFNLHMQEMALVPVATGLHMEVLNGNCSRCQHDKDPLGCYVMVCMECWKRRVIKYIRFNDPTMRSIWIMSIILYNKLFYTEIVIKPIRILYAHPGGFIETTIFLLFSKVFRFHQKTLLLFFFNSLFFALFFFRRQL